MPKYRKKPVVIEAFEWQPEDVEHLGAIIGWFYAHDFRDFYIEPDKSLTISTLEGKISGAIGDFIIRGVAGEFYPCKPGIFASTYEAVD